MINRFKPRRSRSKNKRLFVSITENCLFVKKKTKIKTVAVKEKRMGKKMSKFAKAFIK
jgi:hypothetical protein